MAEEEFSPTGPKIHPERAQREALRSFLDPHTDRAGALLAFINPKTLNLVRIKNIENADDGARKQGIPYADAARQEQKSILESFMSQFEALQNKYEINRPFLEQYLRQKIQTDWFKTELADLKLDEDDPEEQVRNMRKRYPSPDWPGGPLDMVYVASINARLTGNYARSQARLVELALELHSYMEGKKQQ